MSRVRLNLLIDAVIGIAFLATAVTGVVFLLPASWQQAVLVGLSFHAWHWLHDWSGVVAAGGVALHLALHWRWVVHTARRWLADARGELSDRRPVADGAPAPSRAGAPSPVAAHTSPHDPWARQPERPQPHERSAGRLTRRGFVVGAAGFGAAVIGGVALSRVAAAVGTDQTTAGGGTSIGQGGAASSSSSGTTGASSTAGSSASGTTGASSGASSNGSGTATAAARVVVDSSSCIACGHCLQVCPKSVFAWNSAGRATAQSPGSCILCRRCVQICPASAITLNA